MFYELMLFILGRGINVKTRDGEYLLFIGAETPYRVPVSTSKAKAIAKAKIATMAPRKLRRHSRRSRP